MNSKIKKIGNEFNRLRMLSQIFSLISQSYKKWYVPQSSSCLLSIYQQQFLGTSNAPAIEVSSMSGRYQTCSNKAIILFVQSEQHNNKAFDNETRFRSCIKLSDSGISDLRGMPWVKYPPALSISLTDALKSMQNLRATSWAECMQCVSTHGDTSPAVMYTLPTEMLYNVPTYCSYRIYTQFKCFNY